MARTKSIEILSNHFADPCAAQICEKLKKKLPPRATRSERQMARYKAEATAGAVVRMLFKWLADGALIPAAEMVAYATQILTDCCETNVA